MSFSIGTIHIMYATNVHIAYPQLRPRFLHGMIQFKPATIPEETWKRVWKFLALCTWLRVLEISHTTTQQHNKTTITRKTWFLGWDAESACHNKMTGQLHKLYWMGIGTFSSVLILMYINLLSICLVPILQPQLDFPHFLLGTRTNQYKNTAATILKTQ